MKTTHLKRLGTACPRNKKEPDKLAYFDIAVQMVNGRGIHGVTEYCSGVNTKILYDIMKEQRPEALMFNGKIITKREFITLVNRYTSIVKQNVVEGVPVVLPGGIGPIGIEIYQKKKQTPDSRFKKDKDKKFVNVPDYRIKHQRRHLYKLITPIFDLEKYSIAFKKPEKEKIINRYLKDKMQYGLTGDEMLGYAKRIKYGTDSENIIR